MGRIRRATLNDLGSIAEVLRQAYTPEAERTHDPGVLERVASAERVTELITLEETYVLEENGRIVATATLQPLAYLRRIATLPSDQGKGHADALVAHLERRAAAQGYAVAALDTDVDVPWVEEWYARRGFKAVAKAEYLGTGFRTVYMERTLSKRTKAGD